MRKKLQGLILGIVALAPLGFAPFAVLADAGGNPGDIPLPCWHPVGQQWTCSGTCAYTYCRCPGRVRCVPIAVGGWTLGPLANASVNCEEWEFGTGNCNASSMCAGGNLRVPQQGTCGSVTISTQTCPDKCP